MEPEPARPPSAGLTAGPRADRRPATVAIAAGRGPHQPGTPLNVPPVLASVTRIGDPAVHGPYEYGRDGNPTWTALEEVLGELEGGTAVTFASGIAAIAAVLATVQVGGTVVAPDDAYTGARALLEDLAARRVLRQVLVDIADTEAVLTACQGADLLWVETPTNPLLAIADLDALVAGAHAAGVRVAVDSTFATPLNQRPLAHGADLVVHSATKLIAGHSDVLLGAVVATDPDLLAAVTRRRLLDGAVPGPFEAWLALRGLRTLPLRLDRAQANAGVLADRLAELPGVGGVRYPGRATGQAAARVAAQMRGHGTIVSFDLADAPTADRACAAVRLIAHATSLGGVETTMERRNRQPGEEAVPAGLVRVSVGCEDVEDLWDDLRSAVATAVGGP